MKKLTKAVISILCTAAVCGSVTSLAACGAAAGKTEIFITGSSSVTPLMQTLGAVYEAINDNVTVTIQTSDSGTGIADAQKGLNDFGMASRKLKDTETGVISQTICTDGVAMIVNNGCSLEDVTSEQIFALYTAGTAISGVTNGISREDGSGTRGAFDELIKNADGSKTLAKAVEENGGKMANCIDIQNSTGAVKGAVQSNTAGNTIGYISMGSLDDTVKALTFGGIAPTVQNVKSGEYKLSRPFNIVYKSADGLSPEAKAFIEFIMSPAGQYIVSLEGYVTAIDYVEAG